MVRSGQRRRRGFTCLCVPGRRQKRVALEKSGLSEVGLDSHLTALYLFRRDHFAASSPQLPDLKDPEAVQRFFLQEIQLGEEHLAAGRSRFLSVYSGVMDGIPFHVLL